MIKPKKNTRVLGKRGEEAAFGYLSSQGYVPLITNYMPSRSCEADIIALKDNTLVGVEVKSLSKDPWAREDIARRVNAKKRSKVRKATLGFSRSSLVPFTSVRLDVVSIAKGEVVHYMGVEN